MCEERALKLAKRNGAWMLIAVMNFIKFLTLGDFDVSYVLVPDYLLV